VTFRDDPTILGYNIFNEARWMQYFLFLKHLGCLHNTVCQTP
jgi:hypothetical protein